MITVGAEWITTRAGGLNRYAAGLAGGLGHHGVAQHWLVVGDRDQPFDGVGRVQAVSKADSPLPVRWRAMRSSCQDALKSSTDLIASHFALYAWPVRRWCRRLPHVVHFHGPWADESSAEGAGRVATWAKRYLESSVYRTGDRFITLSEAFADVLATRFGIDRSKIRVIPGGVELDRFNVTVTREDARAKLGWGAGQPTVVCVRRLVRRMGLEQLIDAFAKIATQWPDTRLKIAGKGPLEEKLIAQIQSRRLTESVELLGFVPDETLPLVYRAADFSIVPSQSLEGFGLIIAESLASGTPALVTPVGGMPEVVQGLEPNLVLDGFDVKSIADGMERALSGGLRLPSEHECRQYAEQNFDWNVIAGRVLEVYREAIADLQ